MEFAVQLVVHGELGHASAGSVLERGCSLLNVRKARQFVELLRVYCCVRSAVDQCAAPVAPRPDNIPV